MTFPNKAPSFFFVSERASTVSQAQVASLANVARTAVSQWRKRYADFPLPVNRTDDRFLLGEVIGWLDGRTIPASSRAPDEAAGATYGHRVRQRLRAAERPDTALLLRRLRALGPDIRGHAPLADYLYLLLCLAFLRLHDQYGWAQLIRRVPPVGDLGDARRLLRDVVARVDASLGYPDLLSGPAAPPTRLRPRAFEPVRKVVELTADLRPDDFRRLRAEFLREVRIHSDAICTPISVTRTMVALLADCSSRGNELRVYDPFARFGELLTEFVRGCSDPATVRVCAEHDNPAELRLAGMWLAAAGARAELAMTASPPDETTFVLTNPPFDKREQPTWLQRCIASLAEDGRAVVLMPYGAGFTAGTRARDFRRELVEQGAALAVIALPAQMFPGTSIGVCIWLLQRPTGHSAPVQLVDARKLGRPPGRRTQDMHVFDAADITTIAATVAASERRPGFSVLATPDEIKAHGYSLHPPEYQNRLSPRAVADEALAELDALFADLDSPLYTTGLDEGWPRRRLGELCEIRTGVNHDALKRAISRAHTVNDAAPVVYPRHLRDGLIDPGDAPDADVSALQQYRLRTGDVLWVRTGAMGQTAIVRPGESGWLPHTNLLRLRVAETAELEPAYLLALLSQPAVQARIRDRSVRSITTSLSMATLGDIEMPLPPPADQRRILAEFNALDEQTAAIERRLAAARAARTAFRRHLIDGTVVIPGGEDQ